MLFTVFKFLKEQTIFYIFPFYISSRLACFYDWIILFVQQWGDEHRSRLRGSWIHYLSEFLIKFWWTATVVCGFISQISFFVFMHIESIISINSMTFWVGKISVACINEKDLQRGVIDRILDQEMNVTEKRKGKYLFIDTHWLRSRLCYF